MSKTAQIVLAIIMVVSFMIVLQEMGEDVGSKKAKNVINNSMEGLENTKEGLETAKDIKEAIPNKDQNVFEWLIQSTAGNIAGVGTITTISTFLLAYLYGRYQSL